jgi:hypothetical protein
VTGWKEWAIAEVVEASDFQTYVQDQVVQVYADSGARGSALGTAVSDGMVSYLEDTNSVEVYYSAAWNSISNPGDITAVTAGTGLTGGGTTGAVTLNADYTAIGSAVNISLAQVTDVTASASEVNILDGVTATSTELNILAGGTVTTSELNYLGGVSSDIQTQLDGKVDETNGAVTTAAATATVVRNITLSTASPGTADGSDGDVWMVYTP